MQWQGIQRHATTWREEIRSAITHATGQNIPATIYRMCLAGAVYHIWIERNSGVFLQGRKEEVTMVQNIIQEIHVRGSVKTKLAKKLDSMNFYP